MKQSYIRLTPVFLIYGQAEDTHFSKSMTIKTGFPGFLPFVAACCAFAKLRRSKGGSKREYYNKISGGITHRICVSFYVFAFARAMPMLMNI